jgi:hypothetical protein
VVNVNHDIPVLYPCPVSAPEHADATLFALQRVVRNGLALETRGTTRSVAGCWP